MNKKIFQSKLLTISVIFLFILLISSDVLPQRNGSAENDIEKLIQEGKELYKNGEYREAIVKFLEAKDLARTREEISEIHFNLSSAYYANNQSVDAKEHLQKSLEILPERTIDALYYSPGFVEMFNQTKVESIKLKEKSPEVKVKPGEEKKVKKGGKGFLLIIGALVTAGAAVALLGGKKGNGGGNGTPSPTYGSIQVTSNPTGAQVFLDGSNTGSTTNTTLTNVSPGSHTVSLVMEGYEDEQMSVSVTAGQTATVSVTLTKPTITVIELPADTVWTTGEEVEIKWQTSGSGSSQGVASTGAGLNPSINQGGRALSRFQRRAFQQRRFLRSAIKERRKLEDVDSSGNRGKLSSNTSKPQGVSGEFSSSVKEGDIVNKRAKDIGNIKRKGYVGRVNIPVAPQVSNEKFTQSGNIRALGLSYVKIELYKGGTFKQTVADSTENDGAYTWTVDSSLEDGADYKVRISSPDDSSIYGDSPNFKIEGSVLDSPSNLDAEWVSSSQIDLSWTDNSDDESGFKIERKTGASGTWSEVDTVGADVTTYQDTGLEAETTYYYKVRAHNAAGNSGYSNEASASTSDTVPEAPTSLLATSVSSSQIDLSWTDNSSNESGFKIERKIGASGTWAEIDTENADVTTYQDTGLEVETVYYYRVLAYNGAGNSDYSNESSASTSETVPEAPTSLQATAVSSSQINLSWTDNSDDESGFKIKRKEGAAGDWSEIVTLNANVTTYQDTGLKDTTAYYYIVWAYNAGGNSYDSNLSNATTIPVIEWVQVPAGSFEMGDNFNEGDFDEVPVHTVYLDMYYISKYEVTFDQYDAFCDGTGRSKPGDDGWGRGDRPVIRHSWDDAKAFCDWLSEKTGENIHLPTEAQWEKAARGTDQRRYPWGNGSPDSTLANYNRNENGTMPVGSYPAGVSPYGIHDMAGNVEEWCSDWYSGSYYSSSPTNNPQGPLSGSHRAIRGCGWMDGNIRSADRYYLGPSYSANNDIGIRLCKSAPLAKSITVTKPTSSSVWNKRQSVEITWTSTGAINDVKIDLYKGGTFNQTIVSTTANDGSYTWTEVDSTLVDGTDYKVRVSSTTDSGFYDESDAFKIEEKSITVTEPTSSTVWFKGCLEEITWTSKGVISNVEIELYKGSTLEKTVVTSTGNDGSYTWEGVDIVHEPGTDYKVRISDASDSAVYDESDAFQINHSGYEFVTKWGSEGSGDGQFVGMAGVAVDSSGNVYVGDDGSYCIKKFTSDGTFLIKWGSQGSGDGQFDGPKAVAVDSSNNVYVVDHGNQRIQKFESDGTFITKWGSGGSGDGQFYWPTGVAVDSSGNVYVADRSNHRIQKFTSDGIFVAKWGSEGSGYGQFNTPLEVAVDSSGNVYVADSGNHRIQKFTSSGGYLTQWGNYGTADGQFESPYGIAVDSSANVYVADTYNSRIQKFTSDGTFLTRWGRQGSGDGQFCYPGGIAVDSFGNVYVSDGCNYRIQKFRPVSTGAQQLIGSNSKSLNKAPLANRLKEQQKQIKKKDK